METNGSPAHENGTGSRGRVEPSRLMDSGEQWRDGGEEERR